MNKIAIVNSPINKKEFINQNFDYIIAIEKGFEYLNNQNIEIDIVIGDFDTYSINNVKHDNIIQLEPEKDQSDLEASIEYALSINKEAKIICYQEEGKRNSHFLSQIQFVINYGVEVRYLHSKLIRLHKENIIEKENYHYFSIFVINDNEININDCKFPYKGNISFLDNSLFISNEWIGKKARIDFKKEPQAIIVLENKD